MDVIVAKVLLDNLLNRVETLEDGSRQLTGKLTDTELEALQFAAANLQVGQLEGVTIQPQVRRSAQPLGEPIAPIPEFSPEGVVAPVAEPEVVKPAPIIRKIELDLSTLSLPEPPKDVRLCLDFGTAMSKATLVQDNDSIESEEIHVLQLGVPGDQEQVSEVMLISSVYIDKEAKLWFGKAAVDRSMLESEEGSHLRMDNIKRRLSEEGWDENVSSRFNPTDIEVTQGDMVLAYLMFLTWAVNSCLEELDYPLNLPRRYAMPCLSGEKGRETVHRLRQLVGEAQILADTFFNTLKNGIPLEDFLSAVKSLRSQSLEYPFVAEDITEPLGVAGSIMSWKDPVNMLMMIVDVGAGTSDLSLYRVHYDPATGNNQAIEIQDSSRGLTEAGNHLDRMLIELIIKKSGITSDDPMWVNVRSELELRIRDLKESLFGDGFVFVNLMNGVDVDVELDEFLELDAVKRFGESLRNTMIEILESIDQSWVNWVRAHPNRHLVVALTGGGSELPMVQSLAQGSVSVNGAEVSVAKALPFPNWLREINENLEEDYPRIAVSLGGARRRLIERGAAARVTAGDVTATAKLGGYFMKGN